MIYQLILTQKCNLDCDYCFEKVKDNKSMNENMITEVINFIREYQKEEWVIDKRTAINYNGGEALLEYDLLKKMTEEFKKENINSFQVSTNLTLITDEMLDYFYNNKFSLYISIDGDKTTHNKHRKYIDGLGSFDIVYKNIKKIQKKYPDMEKAFSMVLTPYTVSNLFNNFIFLLDMGIYKINSCFCLDYNWSEESIDIFKKEIKKISQVIIDYYKNDNQIYFSLLNNSISYSFFNKPECGVCKDELAILPSGDILPCAVYIGVKDFKNYLLGNIIKGLDYQKINKLLDKNILNLSDCKECDLLRRCHNKCLANNLRIEGNISNFSNIICDFNQICLFEADKISDELVKTKNDMFCNEYNVYKREKK